MSDERTYSEAEYRKIKDEMHRYKDEARDAKRDLETAKRDLEDAEKAWGKERAELEKTAADAVAERDEVVEDFVKFTDTNALARENDKLRTQIQERDLTDRISTVEGFKLQTGVSLEEILAAANIERPKLHEEIPADFAPALLEAAKKSKPYLFATDPAVPDGEKTEAVPQETPAKQALRAFGSQAVGGGAATTELGKQPQVDYSNPAAVIRYMNSLQSAR